MNSEGWITIALLFGFFVGLGALAAHAARQRAARPERDHDMPAKVADNAERDLYLTPGGLYTEADIAANGRRTASQAFRGFRAKHEARPRPGERVCPVTNTKANPECSWVVGGRRYEFCCPPCVDEFVKLAKEQPEAIKPPEEYVRR